MGFTCENKNMDISFLEVKETTDPKVYFTNQDKQNLLKVKHSTCIKFCGICLTFFRNKLTVKP